MLSKNKEIMAEIKGHELACVCSAKKSSILEQGTICFCGVAVLTAVITQLWSFGVFCGRFKINGMDGWMGFGVPVPFQALFTTSPGAAGQVTPCSKSRPNTFRLSLMGQNHEK